MDIFDLLFSAMMVFQAGTMFMIGFAFTAIGGLLVIADLRSHFIGKKVKAKIIDLMISERPNGNLYFPVYRFKNVEGETVERTSEDASNMVLNNLPGLSHTLLLLPGVREHFRKSSYLIGIFGLIFLLPGLFVLQQAFLLVEFTPIFIILSVLFMTVFFYKPFCRLYKFLHKVGWNKIKEEFHKAYKEKQPFFVITPAEKKVPKNGFTSRPMELSEIRNRIPKERKQTIQLIIILLVAGGTMLFFADWSVQSILELETHGIRVKGEIIGFKESEGDDSTTYYALFEFTTEQGASINAKDSFGSSHPTLKRGQTIDVLYNPQSPQKAIIDRGLWNWFLSSILGFCGFLLMFFALKLAGYMRIASQMSLGSP